MGSVLGRRDPPLSSNIPSWVDSRQKAIVVAAIIAPIITTTFVCARLYARKFITKHVGWDDWLAAITLPLCLVYSVLIGIWTLHGGGMHQDDLMALGMMDGYYHWIEISSPVYILACMGYKVSILLLFLRLFDLHKWTIRATWVTLAITSSYLFANFVVQLTGCQPLEKFWDSDIPGSCINFVSSDMAFGSLNVITDLMIFVLPLPALWASKLSWKDKFGATLVFFTGAVAFVTSLVRFQYAIIDLQAVDRTYLAGLSFLWMILEVNTGLICSCGPALKPLYRKFFKPEALERFAPAPVRHALNSVRKRPSIWNITAAAGDQDSQATVTESTRYGGAAGKNEFKPEFKSPAWDEEAGRKLGATEYMDVQLHDVGGLREPEARGALQFPYPPTRPYREERFVSDAETVVEGREGRLDRVGSDGSGFLAGPEERVDQADQAEQALRRQRSFV